MRAAAIERDALLARRGDLDRRRGQAPRDLGQSFFAGIVIAPCVSTSAGDFRRHRDVEIGAGQANSAFRRFDEDVREHRKRRFRRDRRRDAASPSCSFSREIVKRINASSGERPVAVYLYR